MISKAIRILSSALFLLAATGEMAVAQNGTGVIRLTKVLVPASDPGHFHLIVKNSSGVTVGNLQNAGNNGSLGPLAVPPGTYTVSEAPGFYTVGTDYTSVISGTGCGPQGQVTVTSGSTTLCTITNTRKPTGTITVKKVTVPANDPGLFTLQITSSYPQLLANFLNAHAPATMGPVTLTSGSTYTINEVAGTGTNLANYTQAISGAGCAGGVVNLTAGGNVVCTITNTRINTTCTGYPLQADVHITWTGIPAAEQTVHICRGGKVKFINGTTAQKTAQYLTGPTSFPVLNLPVTGFAFSPVFPMISTETYKFVGIGLTGVTTGTIVIH